MSRCRHPRVRAWQRWPNSNGGCWVDNGYWFNHGGAQSPEADRLTCLTCGHWLPLGPANDTPEVLVEVRAAELAQAVRDEEHGVGEWAHWTEEENDGWQAHKHGWPPVVGCEAGWLARHIWAEENDLE